ncbi:ATP-binding protein [bacterium]|nr:ATP-binding protein [bacterium]
MSLLDHLITEQSVNIPRLLIYGREKIGKTTLAAEFPDHLLIDIEGGAGFLKCTRTPKINTVKEVWEILCDLETTDTPYKTVIIDSIDWLAALITDEVLKQHPQAKGINDNSYNEFSYGGGYTLVKNKLHILLKKMDDLYYNKNITPILIGHAKTKIVKNPMHDDYDKLELKMPTSVSGLIKEWVDQIIFINDSFYVDKDKKAHDVKRIAYCQNNPAYEGGGRLGLKNFEYITGQGYNNIKQQLEVE